MTPSLSKRVEVVRDALQRGDVVRVGDTFRVVYPLKFKVQTDAEFAEMVDRWRHGLTTMPQPLRAYFIVTPDVLDEARLQTVEPISDTESPTLN